MPYFADFGTFQCLILQISELFNALFYRFRNFPMPYFTGIASGSPVVAASSGLAIQSRESEAAMPYFAFFGFLLSR